MTDEETIVIDEELDMALWRALEKSTTLIARGRLVDSDEDNENDKVDEP